MTIKGVKFILDEEGRKTGVLLDLKVHRKVSEDLYDTLVAESRRSVTRVPLEEVKKRLRARRARRA